MNNQFLENGTESRVVREANLLTRVVFVGGLGGCGKTMLAPIIGSLDRVEIQKYNYTVEHLCTLHRLKKIADDVAVSMIRMQMDLDLYNMMMSRETNFRWGDLSSVFMNPKRWRYIKRLFQAGDEASLKRIEKEKPILHITLHDLLQHSPTLFLALGEKLRMVELVRHPLYMLKQWHVNVMQFYGDQLNPREFSIRFAYKNWQLPWFAFGYEEGYLQWNRPMDRLIYMLDIHWKERTKARQLLPDRQKKQMITIPFERFVKEPWGYLQWLEDLLETRVTRQTRLEMKRQKVPRKMLAEGIHRAVYKKYGWQPPQKSGDEDYEIELRRDFAAREASKEAMEILDRLCSEYENEFLI